MLLEHITRGWSKKRNGLQEELECFWPFREEISVIDGDMYKGERTFIPAAIRKGILKKLHNSHLGVEKTKWRARFAVYWPEMNKEIEKEAGQCIACRETQNSQCKEEII